MQPDSTQKDETLETRIDKIGETLHEIDSMIHAPKAAFEEKTQQATSASEQQLMQKFKADHDKLVNFPTKPVETRR